MDTNALKASLDTLAVAAMSGEAKCFDEGLRSLLTLCFEHGRKALIATHLERHEEHEYLSDIDEMVGGRATRVEWSIDSSYNDEGGYNNYVDSVTIHYDDGFAFSVDYDDVPCRAEIEERPHSDYGNDELAAFYEHKGNENGISCDHIKEVCQFFYNRFGGNSLTLR